MAEQDFRSVFDYHTLRLFVGAVALMLPIVVIGVGLQIPTSISASYYTEARNAFVGFLFVVGAFLLAYNGHSPAQSLWSKVAAIAAVLVAIFPTRCPDCDTSVYSVLHYLAAGVLFAILAYFCLGPFSAGARREIAEQSAAQKRPVKAENRLRVYRFCGRTILASIVLLGIVNALVFVGLVSAEALAESRVVYCLETLALWAFGYAWVVAGKWARMTRYVDPGEGIMLRQACGLGKKAGSAADR